jgi:hypothetical protein
MEYQNIFTKKNQNYKKNYKKRAIGLWLRRRLPNTVTGLWLPASGYRPLVTGLWLPAFGYRLHTRIFMKSDVLKVIP